MIPKRKIMGAFRGRYFLRSPYTIYILAFFLTYLILRLSLHLEISNSKLRKESEDFIPWGCNIPEIVSSIRRDALWESFITETILPKCTNDTSMFKLTYGSKLVRLNREDPFWDSVNCCYYNFWRIASKPDFTIVKSSKCYEIKKDVTSIKLHMEFLRIICTLKGNASEVIYQDQLAHVRYELNKDFDDEIDTQGPTYPLSLMIFGIGSMSRLHFVRALPNTHTFLMDMLGAYEFLGYNALGQGHIQNMYPLLSGVTHKKFYESCAADEEIFLDTCPFPWAQINEEGWHTSFQEEHQGVPLFSMGSQFFRRGFSTQPFERDLRILNLNMTKNLLGHKNQTKSHFDEFCYGPRLSLQNIITAFAHTAHAFKGKKFVHLTWANTVKDLGNSDSLLREMLAEMLGTSSLNNTALVFVSDNGFGPGVLSEGGGISKQEFLETRLPLLYIVLPDWYKQKRPKIAGNLEINTRRLVHARDVFNTFWALAGIPMEDIDDDTKKERKSSSFSLLDPVPKNRTCEDAGILDLYCVCRPRIKLDVSYFEVKEAMKILLKGLNERLNPFESCAQLRLKTIVSAHELSNAHASSEEDVTIQTGIKRYLIVFMTEHVDEVLWEGTVVAQNGLAKFEEVRRIRAGPYVLLCMTHHVIHPFCICK